MISYVQLAQDQTQVGCHVQNFVDKWKQVTSDPWVLKIVEEGLRLKFVSKPPKSGVRTTNLLNIVHMSNILEEVKKLLGKGAIELVPPGQEGQGFYSTFFIVPKKDGGLRPILNLKPLNVYMEKSHFKMETLRSIIQALHVGEWGSTLDLRDAYLQIPMFPPHRKYLRFCVQGVHYQFRAMPFGITVAPRVFTKLMAAVGGHLRSQQIHIFMYLDDWLVKNQIRELLLHQLNQTIQLLVDLGLIINLDKCHLVPSQIITYLGAVFNLNKGLVLPSENRFLAINQAIADIIYNRQCPASHFLRLLGLMASCIDTVPYGRLHMRPIQIYLLYFWRPHIDGLHFKIPVFPILATHLMWWQQERNIFRGVPLQGYPHNKVLWTDASKWGWGAHLGTHQVAGQWPKELINHHINWLEMRAVWNALIEFQEEIQGENLLIRCDNATVVAYINKQGGTKSIPLCLLLWDMMQWCLKHNIHIHAAHIPGKKNCLADKLSRGQKLVRLTEWALKPSIVQHIFQIMGTPNIDLFATRANSQLPVFCSPYPDPLAWTCDALSVSWEGMFAYAFPPPILIPKILMKVRQENCLILLVAPLAPHQSWFPQLLELIVDVPLKLPVLHDLLSQNRGLSLHPNPRSLNLAVWKISADQNLQSSFLQKLPNIWNNLSDPPHGDCIPLDGKYLVAGVLKGKSVPLQLL